MDHRLRVTDPLRKTAPGVTAETPLLTLAWREARSGHLRQGELQQTADQEMERLRQSLIRIADEAWRLRCAAVAAIKAQPAAAAVFRAAADRLEAALDNVGVAVVGKDGEPFEGDLVAWIDSAAQLPERGLAVPRVAEMIEPAILWKGIPVRRGKAVIAVPAE